MHYSLLAKPDDPCDDSRIQISSCGYAGYMYSFLMLAWGAFQIASRSEQFSDQMPSVYFATSSLAWLSSFLMPFPTSCNSLLNVTKLTHPWCQVHIRYFWLHTNSGLCFCVSMATGGSGWRSSSPRRRSTCTPISRPESAYGNLRQVSKCESSVSTVIPPLPNSPSLSLAHGLKELGFHY